MTDIRKVSEKMQGILNSYRELEQLDARNKEKYAAEQDRITRERDEMIRQMERSAEKWKNDVFLKIKNEMQATADTLLEDYRAECMSVSVPRNEGNGRTFSEMCHALDAIVEEVNRLSRELNETNFDKIVPPVKVETKEENFRVVNSAGETLESYGFDSTLPAAQTPKPLAEKAKALFAACVRGIRTVDILMNLAAKEADTDGYRKYVKKQSETWLAEKKAYQNETYRREAETRFFSPQTVRENETFFAALKKEAADLDTDGQDISDVYREGIVLGDFSLDTEHNPAFRDLLEKIPVIQENVRDGKFTVPALMDLKKCGNVMLEVNDAGEYSDKAKTLIEELIVRFLLAFPAGRINFKLIDIADKMNFSPFKTLTKIRNDILMDGITRDDRKLEDAIKDMEQMMYDIQDNKLSYNGVEDIFAYNKEFPANPQSMYLLVVANFPYGFREETARRLARIMQSGNKTGIYTILIRNKAAEGDYQFKPEAVSKFMSEAEQSAACLYEVDDGFTLQRGDPTFSLVPVNRFDASDLPALIDRLKDRANQNAQTVVPLSLMFEETDNAAENGIPSSAKVLDIPIGTRGGEVQNLLLATSGDGSAHAVVIGGTGSGKSNLLHTIITNACYKYSPDELNLYLIDFKGGVEFQFYEAQNVREKQIPHVKLICLTKDLEDGVAVLTNLQNELTRREDLFRVSGVEDIVRYRQLGKPMPRLLVVVDEIQELFERDEKLGQKAIDILREVFKKGRAFGINVLWASQNVPKVPGLKDKVLSQIGNRISLRLNEPDDAYDIKIDPRMVKNLNRPEKGLAVINDIRYGNESVEFRVAYAEDGERRAPYAERIIEKWRSVTPSVPRERLFIVGDEEECSAGDAGTVYSRIPTAADRESKAFESYRIQTGQDYISGKPFNCDIPLRENKANLVFFGPDLEITRDMMGYSLLSVVMESLKNTDYSADPIRIYCANGEMISPKSAADLFNIARGDFSDMIEESGSTEKLKAAIASAYGLYRKRMKESEETQCAMNYTPCFLFIHAMEHYTNLFQSNPTISLTDDGTSDVPATPSDPFAGGAGGFDALFRGVSSPAVQSGESVGLVDALRELLNQAGQYGIHFVISIDSPDSIRAVRDDLSNARIKVFTKGVNMTAVSTMLGGYSSGNAVNNPKIALTLVREERYKQRIFRYDEASDADWYGTLRDGYRSLEG